VRDAAAKVKRGGNRNGAKRIALPAFAIIFLNRKTVIVFPKNFRFPGLTFRGFKANYAARLKAGALLLTVSGPGNFSSEEFTTERFGIYAAYSEYRDHRAR
jgi:hypothetical protein